MDTCSNTVEPLIKDTMNLFWSHTNSVEPPHTLFTTDSMFLSSCACARWAARERRLSSLTLAALVSSEFSSCIFFCSSFSAFSASRATAYVKVRTRIVHNHLYSSTQSYRHVEKPAGGSIYWGVGEGGKLHPIPPQSLNFALPPPKKIIIIIIMNLHSWFLSPKMDRIHASMSMLPDFP